MSSSAASSVAAVFAKLLLLTDIGISATVWPSTWTDNCATVAVSLGSHSLNVSLIHSYYVSAPIGGYIKR